MRTILVLALGVTMAIAGALPGIALGGSAPTLGGAPTGVTCDFNATPTIDWDDLAGALKYSVDVVAGYDTTDPPDGTVDITVEFSFGTGKSGLSELDLPFSALSQDFGSGPVAPIDVDVQVKGLTTQSGGSNKSQNNPFSAPVNCTLPTPV
jgi:hypothetical protein